MCGINRETAPVGARVLIKRRRSSFETVAEVEILEWSPSNTVVKIRYAATGREEWSDSLPKRGVLVETLPDRNATYPGSYPDRDEAGDDEC